MNTTAQQTPIVTVPADTDVTPPSSSDVEPRREDPDWFLVGWYAHGVKDQKDWRLNLPRPADVRVSDAREIPAAITIFDRRWQARELFPMIYIRAAIENAW